MTEAGSEALARAWRTPGGIGWFSAVNQKPIGKRYIVTGLIFFILGGLMALAMRTQLIVPQNDLIGHDLYNQLFTMHGTTMLFLFAVPILEGAAVYLIPPMVGARDMAFPRLGAFGYWCYLFGGILLYSSFLFAAVPDAGWTMYTPLSSEDFSPGKGVDFWLLGITLVEIGSITAAAEIAVTILRCRAPGMSLNRMPLFAWYMLVVSFMILFGFPPLILGDALLEIQRSLDWPFFDPGRGGDPLLWQHLFWIFGHPEVYIIFLPAAGFVSTMIATFAQRPTVGYTWLVVAAVGTGFVSFGLWVHHMFATGIPLVSLGFFSAASMTVSIFAGIQIFAWIATLWLGKPVMKTPMLFIAGFIFIFVLGGLTGVMVAVIPFDWQAHSSYFLIAHFHYVLIGGMVFPLFGAFHYWFPTVTGRMPSEMLGRWSFWLMFIGFNAAFFPMHISGLKGMPRRVYTYPEGMWEWENLVSTLGAYVFAAGILVFLVNLFRTRTRGERAGINPWNAGTLEWAAPLPIPAYNLRSIPRIEDAYPMWGQPGLSEHISRGEGLLKDPVRDQRLMVSSSAVDADFEYAAVQAKPDFAPIVTALAATAAMIALLVKSPWVAAAAGVAFVLATCWWLWRQPASDPGLRDAISDQTGLKATPHLGNAHGRWGLWFAVLGDAVIFVSLLFAYFYLWTLSRDWPAAEMSFSPLLSWLSTMALAGGALFAWIAARRSGRKPVAVGAALLTAVLALIHGFAQWQLLTGSGLDPQLRAYNALVFTLSAFQLLHAFIVLVMAGFCLAWLLRKGPLESRALVLANTASFWLFTAVIGVVTNAVVFIWPMTT